MELNLPKELLDLREKAKEGRDPTCADGTLALLLETAQRIGAKQCLEIGAAEGLTSVALALVSGGNIVCIEKDGTRAARARENFLRFGVQDQITLYEGDAGDILPLLSGAFDLIFSDGPKVQYRRYLPDCKRLLRRGGMLFSDDVFFLGRELSAVPKKRKMLAVHLCEYVQMLQSDPDFETTLYDFGEGLAVSKKL